MLRRLRDLLPAEGLPCYIISSHPPVVISYWHDFYNKLDECATCFTSGHNAYVLAMLGWHRETQERVDELVNDVKQVAEKAPNIKPIFLTNSPNEENLLKSHGLEAVFCHQNAFLDERRYKIIPGASKQYDAIYIARITPFKRHELAAAIPSLKLIGCWHDYEQEHYDKIMDMLPQADWTYKVKSRSIYREINAARTGLCLSEEEGAMFVSAEYLLCGIPVINTANLGGRDEMFTSPYALTVEPTPEAVSNAVRMQIEAQYDPELIRQAILEKMQIHRKTFIDLVQSIYDRENINRDFSQEWPAVYTHKMGIRCSLSPLRGLKRRLRKSKLL